MEGREAREVRTKCWKCGKEAVKEVYGYPVCEECGEDISPEDMEMHFYLSVFYPFTIMHREPYLSNFSTAT